MTLARLARVAVLGVLALAACEPQPPRSPKPRPCPPPPEPARSAAVVGTIGKLHLVESRYPLSRLGDVLAAFKPDLVLLGARVDAYRDDRLEDASFEMTYVSHLAKLHGVPVEPVDWRRDDELGAAPAPPDPWDVAPVAEREAQVLRQAPVYTFEEANGDALEERVFFAWKAEARHRGGDPRAARRHAWLQHLAASAVDRHGRPKRVLAFVDVLDRGHVDAALRMLDYAPRSPVEIVAKAKETMAGDVPPEVLRDWSAQLARARARAAAAEGPEKDLWGERARVLDLAVERRAACCVSRAALSGAGP